MNLKEQQYICMLARCQNLHRASRQLYITPSALSIALSNLEQTLRVSLFEWNGKKMTLTFAGAAVCKGSGTDAGVKRTF